MVSEILHEFLELQVAHSPSTSSTENENRSTSGWTNRFKTVQCCLLMEEVIRISATIQTDISSRMTKKMTRRKIIFDMI
jgi:hypothetical protein